MSDRNASQRTPRHARLFELIRQGHIVNQIAETRHEPEPTAVGEQQFLTRAHESLMSGTSPIL